MSKLKQILELAIQQGASDVHFSAEEPVRFRIDGDLLPIQQDSVSASALEHLLFDCLTPQEQEHFAQHKNLDKSYLVPEVGQFRVNLFQKRKGIAAVMRLIPFKVPTFEQLGLPEIMKSVVQRSRGLILVTGPTGSGKSTTLASMVDFLNQSFPYHILTIEDPVEFTHSSKCSLVSQREIGQSCDSFSDALKYALREDPDVILIGELRDLETVSLALTAAETGHLVLATLHTRGAASSVDRIIDMFPANQQSMIRSLLADSLLAVLSQALLKRADGNGRVAAYEIMVVNSAISNLIREGKVFQIESVIQTGRKEGMILMDQNLQQLIAQKIITEQEAAPYLKSRPPQKDTVIRHAEQNGAFPAKPELPPPLAGHPPVFEGTASKVILDLDIFDDSEKKKPSLVPPPIKKKAG